MFGSVLNASLIIFIIALTHISTGRRRSAVDKYLFKGNKKDTRTMIMDVISVLPIKTLNKYPPTWVMNTFET